MSTVERADCLIWSGEHGAYWGPDRGGYFESSRYAGRYTRAEAESILQGCGPGKRLAIIPAPEYEDEWEALAESLSKALVDILRALRVYSQEMKDAIRRLEAPR